MESRGAFLAKQVRAEWRRTRGRAENRTEIPY